MQNEFQEIIILENLPTRITERFTKVKRIIDIKSEKARKNNFYEHGLKL